MAEQDARGEFGSLARLANENDEFTFLDFFEQGELLRSLLIEFVKLDENGFFGYASLVPLNRRPDINKLFSLSISKLLPVPQQWILHLTIKVFHLKVVIPYTITVTHQNEPLKD